MSGPDSTARGPRVTTARSTSMERSTTMPEALSGGLVDDVEEFDGPVVGGGVEMETARHSHIPLKRDEPLIDVVSMVNQL